MRSLTLLFTLLTLRLAAFPLADAYVAAGFTATTITNCAIWWDGSYGITQNATNGASVWIDKSLHGFYASNDVQICFPLWQPTAAGGQPCLKFDGSTNYFWTSASNVNFMSSDFQQSTLFVVAKTVFSPAQNGILQVNSSLSVGSAYDIYGPFSDGKLYWDAGNNSSARVSATANFNAWTVATYYRSNAVMSIRTNGVQLVTTVGASGVLSALAQEFIGNNSNTVTHAVSSPINGQVGQIIVYTRALSTNEISRVERYLGLNYGILVK